MDRIPCELAQAQTIKHGMDHQFSALQRWRNNAPTIALHYFFFLSLCLHSIFIPYFFLACNSSFFRIFFLFSLLHTAPSISQSMSPNGLAKTKLLFSVHCLQSAIACCRNTPNAFVETPACAPGI